MLINYLPALGSSAKHLYPTEEETVKELEKQQIPFIRSESRIRKDKFLKIKNTIYNYNIASSLPV